jgi:hypothetical protein
MIFTESGRPHHHPRSEQTMIIVSAAVFQHEVASSRPL